MKNGIIKKVKTGLKMATVALIGAATITAGAAIYANVEYANYTTTDEMYNIAEYYDCDTSYMRTINGHNVRMKHNGDEPIYVCVDSAYTDEEKEAVMSSLDSFFGLIGKINSKYRYEIVDQEKFDSVGNKTKIYYTLKEDNDFIVNNAAADIATKVKNISILTTKRMANDFVITINRSHLSELNDPKQLPYALRHELGHTALNDVYEIEDRQSVYKKFQCNTYMNPAVGPELEMFTPNDVKCFISYFAESEEEAKALKPFLKEYTKNYYENFSKKCIEKGGQTKEFNKTDFEFESNLTSTALDGTVYKYLYNLKVEDGKYFFEIIDEEKNKILESCEGETISINGMVVLKDVKLKKGIQPYSKYDSFEKGVVQDLVVGCFEGGYYSRTVCLYDLFLNATYFGDVYELEKGIGL